MVHWNYAYKMRTVKENLPVLARVLVRGQLNHLMYLTVQDRQLEMDLSLKLTLVRTPDKPDFGEGRADNNGVNNSRIRVSQELYNFVSIMTETLQTVHSGRMGEACQSNNEC